MLEVYYLSLAFQAVYNNSATIAGVKLLPFILVQIVVLIASSRIIPLVGRFKWVIVAGPCFLAAGSGALYSIKYGTPETHLYGFQALLGIGIGLAMQNSMLAVQFELKAEPWLISAGTGVAVFSEFTIYHSHRSVADLSSRFRRSDCRAVNGRFSLRQHHPNQHPPIRPRPPCPASCGSHQ